MMAVRGCEFMCSLSIHLNWPYMFHRLFCFISLQVTRYESFLETYMSNRNVTLGSNWGECHCMHRHTLQKPSIHRFTVLRHSQSSRPLKQAGCRLTGSRWAAAALQRPARRQARPTAAWSFPLPMTDDREWDDGWLFQFSIRMLTMGNGILVQ